MRKEDRISINQEALLKWEIAMVEYRKSCDHSSAPRLRSCKAWVYSTENYFFLRSYDTIVACMEKRTSTLYDMLRYVYEYTSTSAQHISKFKSEYGAVKTIRYYRDEMDMID